VGSIREQLPDLAPHQFIVEPARRGTAAALGLAAEVIASQDPEATMISVHADHYLGPDEDAYVQTLQGEAELAETRDALVTVGLRPPYPSTGFGYIEIGEPVAGDPPIAFAVKRFKEKPDLKTAEDYVRRGTYLWHLGLFSWTVRRFQGELRRHAPQIAEGVAESGAALRRGDRAAADAAYLALPNQAVDNAVLEKTGRLLVVCAQFEWHDIGSWADLHDILEQDDSGNFVEGESVLIDSHDCMIHSSTGKLIAAVGLKGMVVIDTDDAILICPKARAQDVKVIVERLKQLGKRELL
jgi:mannose-1-phosphate guanylyltransferase